MSEKNRIPLFFCEKKSVGIMKKISCVDFLLKKKRRKKEKSAFFYGIFFCENSFRDIVRKKGKFINDETYVSSSECYKNVVKSLLVVFKESVSEPNVSNDS
jgi:hypothetical protein